MSVREWARSAVKLLRRFTPDVTPVTEICRRGFDVSRSARSHVDGAVRTKVREVHNYLTDDQLRDIVTRYAKLLSKNGALHVFRHYGGGPIIDIFSQSIQDVTDSSQKERIQQLEAKVVRLERDLSSIKILQPEDIEMTRSSMESKLQTELGFNLDVNQNPEVVLRLLLMKELGAKILDDLIVPHPEFRKKLKSVSAKDVLYKKGLNNL